MRASYASVHAVTASGDIAAAISISGLANSTKGLLEHYRKNISIRK